MSAEKSFQQLIAESHEILWAPCVYDCVSARYVEKTGFKAMCLSGGELAASLCGFPDIGLVTLDELVGAVDRISSCTDIPMIVDIDTGFGNEINLIRTCKRVAQAGAKAVHLEDQTFPKRCGHLRGKEVIPHEAYISKIKAAAWALEGTGCALIARTDSYHILGKDEAISRWQDYTGAEYPFATMDEITLKTIIRSNPGLVLLKNGVVIRKWSNFSFPNEYQLTGPLEELSIGRLDENTIWEKVYEMMAWFFGPLIFFILVDLLWLNIHRKRKKFVPGSKQTSTDKKN